MPYKILRKTSNCKDCPLEGGILNKCYGVSDSEKPQIAFIGEAPGREEDECGTPFVGASGRMLKGTVAEIGRKFYLAHKTNVIICRPPNNKFDTLEAQDAVQCCRKGFIDELKTLKKKGTKVLVAVGASAAHALNIPGSISKNRGSVYMLNIKDNKLILTDKAPYDFVCVPTFHPSFLFRGQLKHEVSFINDLEKAYSIVDKGYKPPKEKFNLYPTIKDLEKFRDKVLKNKTPLGVDIETTSLAPGKGRILMVGLACSAEEAIVIPFCKQHGKAYWSSMDRMKAHDILKELMAKSPTIFQNALFDTRWLEHFGTPVKNLQHDTMILHHCISPELPHNLGYIVSVYGKTPYWKETIHKPERLIDLPDEESRSYNARDCVTLKQILPELIKEAKEDKTYKVYETIAMKLVNPVMMLMRNGVKIDQAALKKWKFSLKRKIKSREKKLYEIAGLPAAFNLSSPDHMRLLLFGEMPIRYEKILRELEEYVADKNKNRTTKKYKALIADRDLFESVVPLYNPIVYKKKTDSGKLAIDKEVMISIQVAANNELARISKLKRRKPEHDVKEAACKKLTEFITAYREYTALSKLDSTYTKFPVDESSRVKFPYRITGTNTGRFASGDKKAGEAGNAQNLPDEAKHIFVAEKGKTLLYGDYSNLELRVTAAVTGDKPLQDVFASGLKVHKINQDLLFGLKEDHPLYKHAYRACKTYIFGRGYGGGLQGIHRRLVQAVPELNLTFEKFCEIDSKYKKAHKAITKWEEKTKDTVLADRCLNNAFGRVRYFLGSDNEITREGLNFPIQSTAADILNMSLIRISDAIDKGILKSKLIITVHDSIGFEVPDNLLKKEAKIIKGLMEAPVKIKGKSYVFPVDFEVGKDWGHLTEYEI